MFSSKTDLWATPIEFFNKYNEKFNFDIDVCALPENAKCAKFFTPEMDGLKQDWNGTCWMNPPYGKEIKKWIFKAYNESLKGNTIVCLLPARTDTTYFHEYIYGKTNVEIEFIKGRLKFGEATTPAPFPSMVVTFKPITP